MLDSCIFNLLNHILPSGEQSKHDILRLEYLSACKIMENEKHIVKILPHLPTKMFKSLLQSVIYMCYLKFIETFGSSTRNSLQHSLTEINITFPKSLRMLILNWPFEELILRDQIPSLDPPVEIFPSRYIQLALQKKVISQIGDMLTVFQIFCNRLIQFITHAVFNCTSRNTQGFSNNLRRLDMSGLRSSENITLFSWLSTLEEILKGIRNSAINTFGHKIDIFADGKFDLGKKKEFKLLRNIIEESLNPNVGISYNFKEIEILTSSAQFDDFGPSEFFSILALGKCEYIQLLGNGVDESYAENFRLYLPELVGIKLQYTRSIESWNFLSAFEHLEQVSFYRNKHKDLIDSICNMNKGLKYLDLTQCSLHTQDLECLAKSIHSSTLLQLDITCNKVKNDSEAIGLIMLCQKLKNIKVLIIARCSLETLSSNSVIKLVNAFTNCDQLELLSMEQNDFSLEKTNVIINGLAQRKSLQYICLNLPFITSDGTHIDLIELNDENKKYLQDLCKTFHEKINIFRHSTIYISWYFYILSSYSR